MSFNQNDILVRPDKVHRAILSQYGITPRHMTDKSTEEATIESAFQGSFAAGVGGAIAPLTQIGDVLACGPAVAVAMNQLHKGQREVIKDQKEKEALKLEAHKYRRDHNLLDVGSRSDYAVFNDKQAELVSRGIYIDRTNHQPYSIGPSPEKKRSKLPAEIETKLGKGKGKQREDVMTPSEPKTPGRPKTQVDTDNSDNQTEQALEKDDNEKAAKKTDQSQPTGKVASKNDQSQPTNKAVQKKTEQTGKPDPKAESKTNQPQPTSKTVQKKTEQTGKLDQKNSKKLGKPKEKAGKHGR